MSSIASTSSTITDASLEIKDLTGVEVVGIKETLFCKF